MNKPQSSTQIPRNETLKYCMNLCTLLLQAPIPLPTPARKRLRETIRTWVVFQRPPSRTNTSSPPQLITGTGRGRQPGPCFLVPLLCTWAQIPQFGKSQDRKDGTGELACLWEGLTWERGLATGFISFTSSSVCPFAAHFL